jgi:hypothetical protein
MRYYKLTRWYIPIKYDIVDGLIDLKIRHKEKANYLVVSK